MVRRTVFLLAALTLVPGLSAAPPPPEPVTFPTADGVELSGTWYPGTKGRNSPCVLLLADPTGDSPVGEWDALARDLQGLGCAALRFDFRGHGRSTTVRPTFWEVPANIRGVKGRGSEEITASDLRAAYLPTLVNDVAAARKFADAHNDAEDCNSGRIVLVGSGVGATVGALWLGEEAHRFRAESAFPVTLADRPESEGITGVVFLNLRQELGGKSFPVRTWVTLARKASRLPVGLLYDPADTDAARQAKGLADPEGKAPVTARAVDDAGDGTDLLATSGVRAKVAAYVEHVLDGDARAPWGGRVFERQRFYWVPRGRSAAIAKMETEDALRLIPTDWLARP